MSIRHSLSTLLCTALLAFGSSDASAQSHAEDAFRPLLFRLSCYDPKLRDLIFVYKKVEGLETFPLTRLGQITLMGNLVIETKLAKIHAPFAGTPREKKESFRVCKIIPIAMLINGTDDKKNVLGDATAYSGLTPSEQDDLIQDMNRIGSLTPEMQAAQILALEALYETEFKARVFPELVVTQ